MKNVEYNTKDIGEAAALITKGCDMRNLLWKDGIAYFLFTDPSSESISHDYFYGQLQVDARVYYENLRMLKRQLYSEQKGDQRVRRS